MIIREGGSDSGNFRIREKELRKLAAGLKGQSGHVLVTVRVKTKYRRHPFATQKMSSPIKVDDLRDLAGPKILGKLNQVGEEVALEALRSFDRAKPGVPREFVVLEVMMKIEVPGENRTEIDVRLR